RWYKLHSKAGKKEKERGEILVSIQFTRNNLTASMFDLSMKDKPRSPFGKLKDKVKGKKKYDLESASAIIPSSMGALDGEDDYDIGGKKSKVKGFFLKNKLRKSSLTQSNTSLGSDSTISSASLGLAANLPEVTKSPSRHSSLSTERSVKDYLPSPKLTHKRAFSDDVSQVSPVLEPKAIQNLTPKNDPVSRSSLCINGSHVYSDEPAPKSPAAVPQAVPRRHEEGYGFTPLHPDPHDVPWGVSSFERAQHRDEPRFIPSPPSLALQEELKVSTKAVTLSNHLGRARMEENSRLENKPTQAAAPVVFSTETAKDKPPEETRRDEKKAKGGLFHHGGSKSDAGSKGQAEKVGPSHGSSSPTAAGGDERNKTGGWFGSKEPKESPQKPSLEVSPQVETSSDAPSHFPPRFPARFPPAAVAHLARMPGANLPPAPGDAQPGCLSPTNPFLNSLQNNPFFEDLLADQVLNSPSPTHFFSSFSSGPRASTEKPAVPPPLSEWDDTFDAFATSRLKPELKKENFFASVAAEGMAFIDDPDAASPTERSAEPAHEEQTKAFEKADTQIGEMPATLRSWTNFSGLDVGANLVSTTQEATVIEDVLSPVSAGSGGRRRKSSTPTVWTLNPAQLETFWTALEEQEAAGSPAAQRLARGDSPPQAVRGDGEGRAGVQPEPGAPGPAAAPPREAQQGRCSGYSRIDFKTADFWKPDRAEEKREQDASSPRNPFAAALSPDPPSNPFVEKPPIPLPVQAVLPEKLGQGGLSFTQLREEALGRGFQPTNPPKDQFPSLHASQPLAFSTPFLVAATNPPQFDFPSPVACLASSGVPAASSRPAARPWPLPQSGDTQASALVVLPRETQPAEKSLFQQTTSPHPVKPISATVQEVSSEKKQQHRSSLTSALSNGLEKLKTVTTSSVQPVAPSSHPEKTDSKKLKDPTVPDQSAKYYHLTHDELIQLLLQREKELSKKEEHIQELENYIDQLLVRIMEQSPTLLQIPLGESNTK
ncbi:RFIP5 protein, partial [Columbina picui]|nr:RFIP5 protein [Columbina picui]